MATRAPGSVATTGNVYVDALVWGDRWDLGSGPITYMFDDALDTYGWYASEIAAFGAALDLYANVANLSFQVTSNYLDANLVFYSVDDAYLGEGVLGQQSGPSADASFGIGYYNWQSHTSWFSSLDPGGEAFNTIVHELGHALGLAHPHDEGGTSTVFPGVADSGDVGPHGLNDGHYTIMSYNETEAPLLSSLGHVATPMAFDIAALQHIYGANMTHATGDDIYVMSMSSLSGMPIECVWDAGGSDTISAITSYLGCTIDLRAAPLTGDNAGGYLSFVNGAYGGLTIANGVTIENAFGGSGRDVLTGNEVDNELWGSGGDDTLTGLDGNDTLVGGTGADLMAGGSGDDFYYVDSVADSVVEAAGGGLDTVQSSISFVLSSDVENLVLTGSAHVRATGNAAANLLTGNGGNNLLSGGAGNDTLDGGGGHDTLVGGQGADVLKGGVGNDVFEVDHAADRVIEALGGGLDTVRASVSYTLGANLESLVLTGGGHIRATGNAAANGLTGNAGNNLLSGAAGNDTLNGGGGRDTLIGGQGADVLIGGAGGDRFRYLSIRDGGDSIRGYTYRQGDRLEFRSAAFGRLPRGSLAASRFETVSGGGATRAETRFIYDSRQRTLTFDSNGSRRGGAVRIASFQSSSVLTARDIVIV